MSYLHHLMIYFPVALAVVAALCAVVGRLQPDPFWPDARRRLGYLAALGAIGAAASGLLSADHLIEGGVAAETVAVHRNFALGAATLLVLAALAGWAGRAGSQALRGTADVLAISAALVVGAGAHFGGDMLHPGMAPWSNKPHTHGADPHGHVGPEVDGDHDHAGMAPTTPAGHENMVMDASVATATASVAPDAGVLAPPPSRQPAPAASTPHVHQHGATGADPAPRASTPPLSAPPPPSAPPAMTGMPPGHQM